MTAPLIVNVVAAVLCSIAAIINENMALRAVVVPMLVLNTTLAALSAASIAGGH